MTLGDAVVNTILVIAAVAGERGHSTRDLVERQRTEISLISTTMFCR
jgi:hypothetical protein